MHKIKPQHFTLEKDNVEAFINVVEMGGIEPPSIVVFVCILRA